MDRHIAAQLLNVSANGSPDDFKKAYRKQALKNHPDKGGDPEVFKEMRQAYETLTSKEENPWEGLEEMFSMSGMEKMFSHMFRRETPKKLKATHLDMALTLAELYKGGVFGVQQNAYKMQNGTSNNGFGTSTGFGATNSFGAANTGPGADYLCRIQFCRTEFVFLSFFLKKTEEFNFFDTEFRFQVS